MYTIVRNHVDHIFSEYFRIIEMFWSDSPRLVVSDDAREADKATPSSQLWSKISDVNPHIWCWSTWHIRKTRNDVFEAQKELADKKRAMEEGKRPSPYSFKPLTGCKVVAYAIAATVGGPLQALRRHFAYCCFGSRCVLVWGGLTWVIAMHCFSSTVEAVQSRKNTKKQFRQKHHERPQPKSISQMFVSKSSRRKRRQEFWSRGPPRLMSLGIGPTAALEAVSGSPSRWLRVRQKMKYTAKDRTEVMSAPWSMSQKCHILAWDKAAQQHQT